jgi:mannose-6-phosphate isomerase-like protein (cupin superfamily)
MALRRVVTGEVDGRSRVVSDETVTGTPYCEDIWYTSPDEPLGRAPVADDTQLQAPPGASHWRVFAVPTDQEMHELLGDLPDDGDAMVDRKGFHLTETIDLVYVLDGDISLEMDEGEVLLHRGDCVVQRRTNHAWRNRNDFRVHLLAVMTTLP